MKPRKKDVYFRCLPSRVGWRELLHYSTQPLGLKDYKDASAHSRIEPCALSIHLGEQCASSVAVTGFHAEAHCAVGY